MTFSSREEAGRELGQALLDRGIQVDVVLGLPRGGVVVAGEVARILQKPLSALVVRKIGHPRHREFAVGALAEHAVVVLDRAAVAQMQVNRAELDEVIAEETARLEKYQATFHRADNLDLAGKAALLVDDGLATGATTEAAVLSAREQGARRVIVGAPVASVNAFDRLRRVADDVIALLVDPDFMAVGQYYSEFPQTTDEEVIALLHAEQFSPK
ncbi:MAG TPA: phosphoribosyltransferase family protein [Verrucomicrobiae bacterium]|nr:phosphoribosyltransferase family protein [Verrucomicrobiae bacterium]